MHRKENFLWFMNYFSYDNFELRKVIAAPPSPKASASQMKSSLPAGLASPKSKAPKRASTMMDTDFERRVGSTHSLGSKSVDLDGADNVPIRRSGSAERG